MSQVGRQDQLGFNQRERQTTHDHCAQNSLNLPHGARCKQERREGSNRCQNTKDDWY